LGSGSRFSVIVHEKIVAFILRPFLEIIVVLHPVFAKLYLCPALRQELSGDVKEQDQTNNEVDSQHNRVLFFETGTVEKMDNKVLVYRQL
jgi:hypothetical protein